MKSFIFSCNNPGCELTEVKLRSFKTNTGTTTRYCADNEFRFDLEDDEVETKQFCPSCEAELQKVRQLNCAVFLGTTLMSGQQKQSMLLKRSREHSAKGEQRDHRSEMLNRQNREFGLPSKNK